MKKIALSAFSDEAACSILDQVTALKRNDIFYTELRSLDGKNVSSFCESESKEYAKIFAEEGIKVWSIGSPLGKVDIDVNFNEYKDTVKKVCQTANIFGTDKIRMFSFFNAYDKKEMVFDYLNAMVEIATEYGVTLYHENEKDIYGDVAKRVVDIMENVKGLKYIYDPANYLQVGEKADDTLSLLHSKTDYFHIKDVIVSTGELVPAGYGDGKIDKLVDMINDEKTLTLEPHLAVFDAYKSIDNTEMKHKFKFSSNGEAFDCAVNSLKEIILQKGYRFDGKFFVKE